MPTEAESAACNSLWTGIPRAWQTNQLIKIQQRKTKLASKTDMEPKSLITIKKKI